MEKKGFLKKVVSFMIVIFKLDKCVKFPSLVASIGREN